MTEKLSQEKKQDWLAQIQTQQLSGRSISWWCREHKLNYDSFLYWRKKFGLDPVRSFDRSSFKELPSEPMKVSGITIEYHQAQIHLTGDFDSAVLTKCLRVLKEARC